MYSNSTERYGLPLFATDDIPSWLDINTISNSVEETMSEVSANSEATVTLAETANTNATTALAASQTATTEAQTATTNVETLHTEVVNLNGDVTALRTLTGSETLVTEAQTLTGAINELSESAGGSTVTVSADYSTGTKLATIGVDGVSTDIYAPSSTTITVDDALSTTSENPVQNKVVTNAIADKADSSTVTALSSSVTALQTQAGSDTLTTTAQTLSGAINELNSASGGMTLLYSDTRSSSDTTATFLNNFINALNNIRTYTQEEFFNAKLVIGNNIFSIDSCTILSTNLINQLTFSYNYVDPTNIGITTYIIRMEVNSSNCISYSFVNQGTSTSATSYNILTTQTVSLYI